MHIKTYENKHVPAGPAPILVVLGFDLSSGSANVEDLLAEDKLPFMVVKDGVQRARIFRTHFTEKNRIPQKGGKVPNYLSLIELEDESGVPELEFAKDTFGAHVSAFKLLEAFGDVEGQWLSN